MSLVGYSVEAADIGDIIVCSFQRWYFHSGHSNAGISFGNMEFQELVVAMVNYTELSMVFFHSFSWPPEDNKMIFLQANVSVSTWKGYFCS